MTFIDIATWKQTEILWWTDWVNASVYDNKSALIQNINDSFDKLNSYNNYVSTLNKDLIVDCLLVLNSYNTIKYSMSFINQPTVPNAIPSDDFRLVYNGLNFILPTNSHTLLQIIDDPESPAIVNYDPLNPELELDMNGLFSELTEFSTLISSLNSLATVDNVYIESLPTSISSAVKNKMLTIMFDKPKITMTDIDSKLIILDTMHLREVLEQFNWSIEGFDL